MIVMNLEVENLLGFKDFKMNFTYPKKIINSTIENEFLATKPNFRYKKVNILMGSNASGKTSVGKILMYIFNFISKRESSKITNCMIPGEKNASFLIDFLFDEDTLYRVECNLLRKSSSEVEETIEILLKIYTSSIDKSDSYESTVKKLKEIKYNSETKEIGESSKLESIPRFGWLFNFSSADSDNHALVLKNDETTLKLAVLENVLKGLDSSIEGVKKLEEVENTYIIHIKNAEPIIIQNGAIIGKDILSSGTKEGIKIAYIMSSMCNNLHGFYYCDENFSFIQSDIEVAIFSLMIELIHPTSQLFFTTHNLDILDMNLPKHSFQFLKKNIDKTIEIINPSKFLQKNDRTLRNAVKNDIFNMAPDTSFIDKISEVCQNER